MSSKRIDKLAQKFINKLSNINNPYVPYEWELEDLKDFEDFENKSKEPIKYKNELTEVLKPIPKNFDLKKIEFDLYNNFSNLIRLLETNYGSLKQYGFFNKEINNKNNYNRIYDFILSLIKFSKNIKDLSRKYQKYFDDNYIIIKNLNEDIYDFIVEKSKEFTSFAPDPKNFDILKIMQSINDLIEINELTK
jgi:hypothetical protein